MFQKLDEVEKRYEEVTRKISDPEIIAQQSQWQALMKEHAEIEPVVLKYQEYIEQLTDKDLYDKYAPFQLFLKKEHQNLKKS